MDSLAWILSARDKIGLHRGVLTTPLTVTVDSESVLACADGYRIHMVWPQLDKQMSYQENPDIAPADRNAINKMFHTVFEVDVFARVHVNALALDELTKEADSINDLYVCGAWHDNRLGIGAVSSTSILEGWTNAPAFDRSIAESFRFYFDAKYMRQALKPFYTKRRGQTIELGFAVRRDYRQDGYPLLMLFVGIPGDRLALILAMMNYRAETIPAFRQFTDYPRAFKVSNPDEL